MALTLGRFLHRFFNYDTVLLWMMLLVLSCFALLVISFIWSIMSSDHWITTVIASLGTTTHAYLFACIFFIYSRERREKKEETGMLAVMKVRDS